MKFEAIDWPDGMKPSQNPIHFTNELEVEAAPEAIWTTLTDITLWPDFYPNVGGVTMLGGAERLAPGARFEAALTGLDVLATVREFEPMTRIAWYGGPKHHPDDVAYHAWIITPTVKGTHLWTEEVMRGSLWVELAKSAPDRFWRDHERLLRDLAKVAANRVR